MVCSPKFVLDFVLVGGEWILVFGSQSYWPYEWMNAVSGEAERV